MTEPQPLSVAELIAVFQAANADGDPTICCHVIPVETAHHTAAVLEAMMSALERIERADNPKGFFRAIARKALPPLLSQKEVRND